MSQYRRNHERNGAALMSGTFGYSDEGLTLAELLEPGFFPASAQLRVGEIALLAGSDGWTWAMVVSVDKLGLPTLMPPVTQPLPALAPISTGRKAA